MAITTCVFDAYGTLFDVAAAAQQTAEDGEFPELQDNWQTLAKHWRDKQLQYTWMRAITNTHDDFWNVTQDGLDWALEATKLELIPNLRKRLLDLYWELRAFPEVVEMLQSLKSAGKQTAILSNGSPDMLHAAARSAGISELLDAILSVADVGVFKPDSRVYDLVNKHFNCTKDQVLFVSSNGWDASCAAGYGFITAWVNRNNEPVDRLPWRPLTVLPDLTEIPQFSDV